MIKNEENLKNISAIIRQDYNLKTILFKYNFRRAINGNSCFEQITILHVIYNQCKYHKTSPLVRCTQK